MIQAVEETSATEIKSLLNLRRERERENETG
jgi:hypothetical protein